MSQVYVLKKEEGGGPAQGVLYWLPAAVLHRTMDVTGTITLPEGVEMVMQGITSTWK